MFSDLVLFLGISKHYFSTQALSDSQKTHISRFTQFSKIYALGSRLFVLCCVLLLLLLLCGDCMKLHEKIKQAFTQLQQPCRHDHNIDSFRIFSLLAKSLIHTELPIYRWEDQNGITSRKLIVDTPSRFESCSQPSHHMC